MFKNVKVRGIGESPEEYHEPVADRGSVEHPASPSMLKQFGWCANRWFEGYTAKDTKAKAWGNLLDCLLLTPSQFDHRYAVQPETYKDEKSGDVKPWNGNSNVCKKWIRDHEGLERISFETHRDASAAVLKLMQDDTIKRFVNDSDRQVWLEGEWHDKQTELVIPVKCLIDLAPRLDSEFSKCLGDLKSTRSSAVIPFLRDAYKMGHHIQAAFDLDMYRAAYPEWDKTEWCLIVQENYEPWHTEKRALTDDPTQPDNFLHLGRVTYQRLLRNYCACLKTGVWPGHNELEGLKYPNSLAQGWLYLRAEPWMQEGLPEPMSLESGEPEDRWEPNDDVPV